MRLFFQRPQHAQTSSTPPKLACHAKNDQKIEKLLDKASELMKNINMSSRHFLEHAKNNNTGNNNSNNGKNEHTFPRKG